MSKGFTFIELLVAIMIVSILSVVAVSSYQDYTLRTQRADAKAVLLEAAARLERNYTAIRCYDMTDVCGTGTAVSLSTWGLDRSPKETSSTKRYEISFTSISPTGFTLKAHPVGSDPTCLDLGLDNLGNQTVSGTGSVADCWQH